MRDLSTNHNHKNVFNNHFSWFFAFSFAMNFYLLKMVNYYIVDYDYIQNEEMFR